MTLCGSIFTKKGFPEASLANYKTESRVHFKFLNVLVAYQIKLPGSMEVSIATFNVSDLQLYYKGDLEQHLDSRTSHFQPGENDEVSFVGTTSKDVSRAQPLSDYSIAKQRSRRNINRPSKFGCTFSTRGKRCLGE